MSESRAFPSRYSPSRYSLDGSDRILSVSDSWVDFASQNDAPELTRECVLGQCVWDFVAGSRTREVYELLFRSVRRHAATISLPFRCDSPDCLRFMHLQMSSGGDDRVDLAAVLDREERRPHMRIFDRFAPRSDYAFPLCSFCRRIFAFGSWLEPEEAVRRLGWLESQAPPQIEEDLCPDCAREGRSRIAPSESSP